MFGSPRWFRPKRIGWGLTPICWQGWVYALVWIMVLAGPYLAVLYMVGLWWATALEFLLIAVLTLDTRHILLAIRNDQSRNR